MGELSDFQCHSMCKKLKLTYMIFTDDLMIFYEGNINSVSRLMEELTHFSAYSKQFFWSSVFILPLASWEQVCIPKNFGGLNIKGSKLWNMASVGRLLWQLAMKEDVL
ncbi:hypothetical protein H5410_003780 [Solanum commersonii]|uniref:Reverse transcriptase n=1 Tax=Solanum commersonii TaxID=4109 RepID=A0A9J6B6L2_SOLCO|nr:hypothetical protein H5410_003780 [Solanum commersonii]